METTKTLVAAATLAVAKAGVAVVAAGRDSAYYAGRNARYFELGRGGQLEVALILGDDTDVVVARAGQAAAKAGLTAADVDLAWKAGEEAARGRRRPEPARECGSDFIGGDLRGHIERKLSDLRFRFYF